MFVSISNIIIMSTSCVYNSSLELLERFKEVMSVQLKFSGAYLRVCGTQAFISNTEARSMGPCLASWKNLIHAKTLGQKPVAELTC
jgi:hypothetical protein